MTGMKLEILDEHTGYFGFVVSAQNNTPAVDFCRLMGEGLLSSGVKIGIDEENYAVAIIMDGFSVNFQKDSGDITKIAKLLSDPVRVEEYCRGNKTGFMVVAQ